MTLVELLVSIALLGTVGVSILVAFIGATVGAATSDRIADQQAALSSAQDYLSESTSFRACSPDNATEYTENLLAVDVAVTVDNIEYWDGASFQPACGGRDTKLQRVTLRASGSGGSGGATLQVLVADRQGLPTAWNPVERASGFSLLVAGKASVRLTSTGSVAVGGNLITGENHFIVTDVVGADSYMVPGDTVGAGLIVGGSLDLQKNGTSSGVLTVTRGNVYVADLKAKVTTINGATVLLGNGSQDGDVPRIETSLTQSSASVQREDVFPFAAAFTELRNRSAQLSALSASSCPNVFDVSKSGSTMTLVADKVNVLTTSIAGLGTTYYTLIGGAAGSPTNPLVVNITDSGTVTVPEFQWAQQYTASAILWNFPNASRVVLSGANNFGTIFAPGAQVDGAFSNLSGAIIGSSYTSITSNSGLTSVRFVGEIPCL